jgi:ribonuclease PH
LDESGKILAEIDVYLENGDYILAVEVKSKPAEKDIAEHIERLKILRENRDKYNKGQRIIQGAIAGAIFKEKVKEATLKAGLYVLAQSGDTMKMEIPPGFKPREW